MDIVAGAQHPSAGHRLQGLFVSLLFGALLGFVCAAAGKVGSWADHEAALQVLSYGAADRGILRCCLSSFAFPALLAAVLLTGLRPFAARALFFLRGFPAAFFLTLFSSELRLFAGALFCLLFRLLLPLPLLFWAAARCETNAGDTAAAAPGKLIIAALFAAGLCSFLGQLLLLPPILAWLFGSY